MGGLLSHSGPPVVVSGAVNNEFELKDLHDLDLCLIRSQVRTSNVHMDYQTARAIRSHTHQNTFESTVTLEQWDRVGIISTPEWKDPADRERFSTANVMVTEATSAGIRTVPLRDVLADAISVSIRPLQLHLPAYGLPQVVAQSLADDDDDDWDPMDSDEDEQPEEQGGWKQVGPDEPIPPHAAQEVLEKYRSVLSLSFYRLLGPIANKPWKDLSTAVEPLLTACRKELEKVGVSVKQRTLLSDLIDKHDPEHKGFDLDSLLEFFAGLQQEKGLVNTFSQAEIHSLLTDYGNAAENGKDEEKHGHGRGRRAHRRHGHEHKRRKELDVNAAQQFRVSKDDFMRVWEASYRRTMAARTNAREVLSGFFVSYVLQQIGLLPPSEFNFYTPVQFSQFYHKELKSMMEGQVVGQLRSATLLDEIVLKTINPGHLRKVAKKT